MNIFYNVCRCISCGILIGFLLGGFKMAMRKEYTQEQKNTARKFINKVAFGLKYITFLLLTLGLVWCIYFLVLGALVPSKTDYANNRAELIVSVLTVISIIFAFVEFLRRADD